MLLTRLLAAATAGCLLSAVANAQAFNIDISASNATLPTPTPDFGAYALQPGFWTSATTGVTNLIDLVTGAPTNVTLDVFNSSSGFAQSVSQPVTLFNLPPNPTQDQLDLASLYEDFQRGVPNNRMTIRGLEAGTYRMLIYTWTPGSYASFRVTNLNSGAVSFSSITHPTTFPGLAIGSGFPTLGSGSIVNMRFVVGANDTIQLDGICQSDAGDPGPFDPPPGGGAGGTGGGIITQNPCPINGIQLYPVLSTADCDQPLPNSVGSVPFASVSGDGSIGSNNMSVSLGIIPGDLPTPAPTVICFASNVLEGDQVVSCGLGPVVGQRCLGSAQGAPQQAPIVRVLDVAGAPPVATAFGVYRLTVDLDQLETEGLTIAPNVPIHFQFAYRDTPTAADMCPNSLPIVRWSRSATVTLTP